MQDIARHVGTFHVHLSCSRKTKLALVHNGEYTTRAGKANCPPQNGLYSLRAQID